MMVEAARGSNAIGESVGRAAVGIGARAEDDDGIGGAAVIGFAEAEHLQDCEGGDASGGGEGKAECIAAR